MYVVFFGFVGLVEGCASFMKCCLFFDFVSCDVDVVLGVFLGNSVECAKFEIYLVFIEELIVWYECVVGLVL